MARRIVKQKQLPGTETPKDKKISKALEEYSSICSDFASLRHELTQKRAALTALLKDRGITAYDDPELGVGVSITNKEKLALAKLGDSEDDEDDENEESGTRAA